MISHQGLCSGMLSLQAHQCPVGLGLGSLEERQPVILEALKGCLCPAELLHQRCRPVTVGFDKAFLYAADRRGSGICWQQNIDWHSGRCIACMRALVGFTQSTFQPCCAVQAPSNRSRPKQACKHSRARLLPQRYPSTLQA